MVNYKAIADAYEAGGYVDAVTAFDAMSAQTVPGVSRSLTGNDLRIWAAMNAADYAALKAAVSADPLSEIAVLLLGSPSSVLDMADPRVQAMVSALPITQAGKDALHEAATQTNPMWPGLKIGHITNALQKREAGVV